MLFIIFIKNDYTIKVLEDYLLIGKGIALGVEIAQREACMVPNILDHFIENNCCPLIRYMDDSVFIIDSYDKAKSLLDNYISISNNLNIIVNPKKTKIVKLNQYFKYCKWNYKLLDSGKVIIIPHKKTIYRQRRKLRKMYKLYKRGFLSFKDLDISRTCFKAYLGIENSNKYINYLDSRYNEYNL